MSLVYLSGPLTLSQVPEDLLLPSGGYSPSFRQAVATGGLPNGPLVTEGGLQYHQT